MARDIEKQLVSYLRDAHAMEKQSLQTLEAAAKMAGDPQLEALYRGHIRETKEHLSHLADRLEAYGESRSRIKDIAMRGAALGVGAGLVAQPDTPAKLAAVAYAFENFEIASYELLKRVAERAGDHETVGVADRILVHERQAVEKIAAGFDLALERSLEGAMSG
jgi:ferritin-like metal-binding protein YciE